jgi:hypothetical protein
VESKHTMALLEAAFAVEPTETPRPIEPIAGPIATETPRPPHKWAINVTCPECGHTGDVVEEFPCCDCLSCKGVREKCSQTVAAPAEPEAGCCRAVRDRAAEIAQLHGLEMEAREQHWRQTHGDDDQAARLNVAASVSRYIETRIRTLPLPEQRAPDLPTRDGKPEPCGGCGEVGHITGTCPKFAALESEGRACCLDMRRAIECVLTDNAQDDLEDPIGHAERERRGYARIHVTALNRLRATINNAETCPGCLRPNCKTCVVVDAAPESEGT